MQDRDTIWRHVLRLVYTSAVLVSLAIPAVAMDGTLWLFAYQAYLRQDYASAHRGFTQLLQGDLSATDKAEILRYDALALRHLQQPADAAKRLEALYQLQPNDPHFEEMAFLYRYYLDTGAFRQAEAMWQQATTQWGRTAGVWKLVAEHTDYLAQRDPIQVVKCAERLGPLTIAKEDLILAFYQPLFRHGQYEKAKEVQTLLHQYFADHRPSAVELNKRAYEDAISASILESYFTQFITALEVGDLDAARAWLANLNGTVPEHPRATEARKRYHVWVQAASKEQ